MYKLLHIHSNIVFIDHSRRYITDTLHNEILFLGVNNEDTTAKLSKYGITYRIFDASKQNFKEAVEYANTFDGVIFHCLYESSVRLLFKLKPKVKVFLKLFGQELYMLSPENFLSSSTLVYQSKPDRSLLSKLKTYPGRIKRKLKIALNKEHFVQRDNQRKVYERLDAILIISKYEYNELSKLFHMPRLIERQLVDQVQEINECKISPDKLNTILIGNSGHRWNNHIDVLNIIKEAQNPFDIEFRFFFSYGTESVYSQTVKSLAQQIENTRLIEKFLNKEEFETIYTQAAALVINSYRQHAIGNIITGIKYGCKIYLNKRSSTYHWLISQGFLISEVESLKEDIETGNIKLDIEQQQRNINCFIQSVNNYTISDFLSNVTAVLES